MQDASTFGCCFTYAARILWLLGYGSLCWFWPFLNRDVRQGLKSLRTGLAQVWTSIMCTISCYARMWFHCFSNAKESRILAVNAHCQLEIFPDAPLLNNSDLYFPSFLDHLILSDLVVLISYLLINIFLQLLFFLFFLMCTHLYLIFMELSAKCW